MSLCLIGKVVGVHGIAGMLKVHSYSDIPGRFELLETVLFGASEDSAEPRIIEQATGDRQPALMKLAGIDSRDDAEQCIGHLIYITDEQMLPPPEGKHFIHDLIGCTVQDEAGNELGTVTDVAAQPASDIYTVERDGFEYMIPAVPEFVKKIDIAAKTIIVAPIPGMLDDDADEI
ncbi:MAG: 16S rRNA processing protein RimM [Ectothiorhodospiraceae bacterium]|nr:16S rRNA processing protein RimM [Ectothiorhodospiraceae bacterium]